MICLICKYSYLKVVIVLTFISTLLPLNAFAEKSECDVLAKVVMGGLRKNTLTIEQFQDAKRICTKLAIEGDPEAQYHLGGLNTVHINDVYPNEPEMWKWMKLSAENGFANAQGFLGRSYETDKNFLRKKDINLSIKWHTLAAEQHDIASIIRLEEIYRKGLLGVEVNIDKANYWAGEIKKQ